MCFEHKYSIYYLWQSACIMNHKWLYVSDNYITSNPAIWWLAFVIMFFLYILLVVSFFLWYDLALKWFLISNQVQYIPRNMHTVFALLCFVVVIHWLIFPYPSGLLHWHCGNLTIAPVPAKQPWWTWINTSCEFIMNDCITTTKQSTTKPCAYFLGYTVTICLGVHVYTSLARNK